MTRALMAGEARVGFCAGRPSGHHAEADRAMGFCLFNNVAIAAAMAVSQLGARRVFILDWDVHHGNGTAAAFYSRADVLFASIHQMPLYPGTGALQETGAGEGEGHTLNLPVPPGSTEELWLSLLEHIVIPAMVAFEPDLLLVSAGFDGHAADPLAGCRLQTSSFAQMACLLRDTAAQRRLPLGVVLEGGYEPQALGECVRGTLAALGGEGEPRRGAPWLEQTSHAAAVLGKHWSLEPA
jgi:acetoin utilization deacetylase AcuC-like enzyme